MVLQVNVSFKTILEKHTILLQVLQQILAKLNEIENE